VFQTFLKKGTCVLIISDYKNKNIVLWGICPNKTSPNKSERNEGCDINYIDDDASVKTRNGNRHARIVCPTSKLLISMPPKHYQYYGPELTHHITSRNPHSIYTAKPLSNTSIIIENVPMLNKVIYSRMCVNLNDGFIIYGDSNKGCITRNIKASDIILKKSHNPLMSDSQNNSSNTNPPTIKKSPATSLKIAPGLSIPLPLREYDQTKNAEKGSQNEQQYDDEPYGIESAASTNMSNADNDYKRMILGE
jgi:hypothetical protein